MLGGGGFFAALVFGSAPANPTAAPARRRAEPRSAATRPDLRCCKSRGIGYLLLLVVSPPIAVDRTSLFPVGYGLARLVWLVGGLRHPRPSPPRFENIAPARDDPGPSTTQGPGRWSSSGCKTRSRRDPARAARNRCLTDPRRARGLRRRQSASLC